MSTNPTSDRPEDHPHGHQAEDEIDYVKVIAVGVVSLVIFALATWWAAGILRHETARIEAATGPTRRGALIGQPEIGIVDQAPFLNDHRLYFWKEERAQRLNGYGWIDRNKGIAHIPIEQAMEAVISGRMPAAAPTGGPMSIPKGAPIVEPSAERDAVPPGGEK